jgi:hypothetical protein
LESDGYAGQSGNDVRVPALKARRALHDMTGLWFPQDVGGSLRAWEKVRGLPVGPERENLWKTLVLGIEYPLKAELEGDETAARIVVTNVTQQAVTVAKSPNSIDEVSSWGNSSKGQQEPEEFVTLKPGDSTRFALKLESGFIHAPAGSRRLTVRYWNSGRKQHLNAWIGSLEVAIGSNWTEPTAKPVQSVIEKWPNGKVKVTGGKVGDQKVGRWTYYNEQGQVVRVEEYNERGWIVSMQEFDTRTTAERNPDHPETEGPAKPKAKD